MLIPLRRGALIPATALLLAGRLPATALDLDRWHLGGFGQSCDDVCAGLPESCTCDLQELKNVADESELISIGNVLGAGCTLFRDGWGHDDQPFRFFDGSCFGKL